MSASRSATSASRASSATRSQFERLATGFLFTEGPLWHPRRDNTCSSATCRATTCARWTPKDGVTTFRKPCNKSNGLAWDRQGRLIVLRARVQPAHAHRGRRQDHGARQPSRRQGAEQPQRRGREERRRHLLHRSDLRAQGRTTACRASRSSPSAASIASTPDGKTLTLLADDFGQPNGLCFSLDEKRLFVNDTDREHIRVFDVQADGTLANGRVWAETVGRGRGRARRHEDRQRRQPLLLRARRHPRVRPPDATCLGVIQVPEYVANFCWGDDDLQEPLHHRVDLALPDPGASARPPGLIPIVGPSRWRARSRGGRSAGFSAARPDSR